MAGRDVSALLEGAVAAFARVARAAPDVSATVPSTPEWTVADLVAHVAIEADRYRREIEGEGEWSADVTAIAETNRQALAAHADRDVDRNLAWLEDSIEHYVAGLAARAPDTPSHGLDGGLLLTPTQGAGVLLGELAVHRWDLAQATGQEAPISRDEAVRIVEGILHTLPAMLDRDRGENHRGAYEIRVRGHKRYLVEIADGEARIGDGGTRRPDAIVSAEPVAFVLTSYARRGPVRTALTGKALAWGRKPHRAFALDRMFHRV